MRSTTINKGQLFLWAFVILLITITLSDSRLGIFSIATPLKVALILLFFLANAKVYFSGKLELPLYKYFIPFFGVAIVSLVATNPESESLFKTIIYFLNLALLPYLVYRGYIYSPSRFLRFFMFTSMGILLVGLLLYLAGFSGVFFVRYRGLLGNPNGLGLFTLFTAISFRVITFYKKGILKRKYLFLGWAIIFLSLYLSNSRNSMISLGIFLIFSSKVFRNRKILQISIVAAVIISFSLLSQKIYEIIVAQGMQEELRVESLEDMQSGSGRKVAHDFALEYIDKNVWVGKGIGTTEKVFEEASRALSDKDHQGNAHNSFFTVWIDTGVIGLFLFIIAWLVIFYKAELVSGFGFPIMIAVAFSAYYESYLAAMLNPFTSLLLVILTLLLIPEFRNQNNTDEEIPQ